MENDILNKLNTSLADFDKSVKIIDIDGSTPLRFGGSSDETGYQFSQKDTIDMIDLYYNSKYKDGKKDKDGQRKLFMNIVRFKANVAEKQTDIDVKNYTFIPDSEDFSNTVWFLKRQFTVWSREHNYGQILNDLNKDYSKYGSCVLRKMDKTVERVPLKTLMNTQDASSLKQAPLDGGYVIIKHQMTLQQMRNMPDWETDGLDFDGRTPVYELYSMFDAKDLDKEGDKEMLGVAYVAPELETEKHILFKEQIDEVPFEEAHWDKQDGRWLGLGEVEKQFENQVAVNMTENLRRKHLIWGAKKVWQTQGNAVVKNLVKEVADGAVLEVGVNGAISEVPMNSQNLAEFQQSKDGWMDNSDQNAFAFEVSTGESLPSGTPFRLGVILANSAARYYELKRENFGLFFYRSFFSHLIPIFKEQTKEHNIAVANGEEGAEFLRDALINYNVNRKFNELAGLTIVDREEIRAQVEKEVASKPFIFAKMPAKVYENVKFFMQLDLTQEEEDTDAQMATLTTLYQTLVQSQDPRADNILEMIVSLTGNNPNKLLGNRQEVVSQIQQGVPTGQVADLSALNVPQNATAQ